MTLVSKLYSVNFPSAKMQIFAKSQSPQENIETL